MSPFEIAVREDVELGEGPIWDAERGRVVWARSSRARGSRWWYVLTRE
ncbi:SMP-30/gluconolactonase/LRE family protein [Streptomyces halobius]|uniref:SMP-30/gluconolactonase/LRE family protein n=1 Tax=Streptomyces halobius TaxID=2879846 RepID=A0ABY4M2X0_9ACTN|nr:SMP-30/gluconolactonase/LRE family protein [Streptomyces halobius]UQA92120.1 SMP-30/gluconolactonase/LRE family protein [Streptomyces halobius]